MDGSLTLACAVNALGGGKVRSSRAKVSRAVADFAPVAILRPPLEGARPAVVGARGEVGVGGGGHPVEELAAAGGARVDQKTDRLAQPIGSVRRVVDDPKGHRRIMRSCAFVQNAARTNKAVGRSGGIRWLGSQTRRPGIGPRKR